MKKDPVKKIFGKTASEIFADKRYDPKPPSNRSFWQDHGVEELKHLERLIDELTDEEVREVARTGGLKPQEADIDQVKGWLDEVGREDFYRVYNKKQRKT